MITFYFLVAAGILLWIHFLWSRRRFYKLMFEIPGPKGIPFLGTVPEYVINKLRIIQRTKHMDKYGSTILIWMGIQPVLLTRDPKIAEDILISLQCLNRTSLITKSISDTFAGTGLLTMKEPEWQQHRKNLNSSFKPNVLLSFLPTFNSEATILVNIIERFVGQKGMDVLPHLLRWSLRTSHQTILDTKVKEDLVNKLIESWQSLLMLTMLNIALPFCRHNIISSILGFERRRVEHLDRLNAFMNDVLQQKLNSEYDPDSPIVINRLVDLFQSGQIGYDHIKGECNSMVIASLETTALSVTHTLILLAMFPEYQDIAFEELKTVFPTSGEFDVDSEDLLKLVYIDRIINETLRLIPPVPVVMREAKHDIRLSNGVLVPSGVSTTIDIFNIHRNKDVWGPNADTFNPDHFLPEKVRDRHPYAFIPFSKGKRNCIGGRYALMSAKIALAKILRNYKLSTSFRYEDLVFIDNIGIKLGELPELDFHRRF